MWQRIKNLILEVKAYLVLNPAVAATLGGWIVVALAKFKLHLTLNDLYVLAMALVTFVSGGNALARRVRDGSVNFLD